MTIRLILCLLFSFLFQYPIAASTEITKQPLKIGFICVGPVSDLGWNYYHDQGRLYLENAFSGKVQTSVVENVPESAEVERVMEKMIAQGITVIFSTSYGYLEPALRVAQRHRDVIIMQCSERANPHQIKNLATYFPSYYETIYVLGTVAGRMTEKNNIGYVAAHPLPAILLGLNAFTLGVHSINPKAQVHVVWVNNWFDPPVEAEAARGLIDQGADVLIADLSSAITVVKTAEKEHKYSIAYNADLKQIAPKGWLTGVKFNWGPLYVNMIRSIIDSKWHAADYRYGIEYGYLRLSSFGNDIPPSVQKQALDLLEKIKQKKVPVFKGPMKDRDGRIVIPAGKTADEACLAQMDWVVPGVEGPLPKSK